MAKKNILLTIGILQLVIIVFVWFHKGLILASGESAIPFYSPERLRDMTAFTWQEHALGNPTTYSVISYPFYFLLSLFPMIPGFLLQGSLYFLLLLVGFLSIYFLVKHLIPSSSITYFIAGTFFVFNLLAIVNIWNRLQYPFMYFYALLPLSFYLIYRAIEKKRYYYAIILNFVMGIFSSAFVSLPIIELYWLIIGLYFLFLTAVNYKKKSVIYFYWKFFILTFILWIPFNVWWILQLAKILGTTSYITSTAYTPSSDLDTFLILSQRLGNLSYVFRLMHVDFLSSMNDIWGNFYFTPPFIVLSYIIPFLAFFPLVLRKKPNISYYFLGLSLLLLFLIKGGNSPFGEIFTFLFSHFRFLEAFRNPFEKFSIALPFAYAPLVGYSFYIIYAWALKKWGKLRMNLLFSGIFGLLFIVLTFPMWNGWVFTSNIPPANNLNIGDYVKVPNYYKDAREWMDQDQDNFRSIALPLRGEGQTYIWEYGYVGVEFSNGLFDREFISLSTTLEFLEKIASQMQYSLFKNPDLFSREMGLLNAKYLMVRSDVDYHARNLTDAAIINKFIQDHAGALSDLKRVREFGKLVFYKNNSFLPKVYAAISPVFASQDIYMVDALSLSQSNKTDVILNDAGVGNNNTLMHNSEQMLIRPNGVIDFSKYPSLTIDEAGAQFVYSRFLPGSSIYPLIRLKERIQNKFEQDPEKQFFTYITLVNKRMGELRTLVLSHKTGQIALSVDYLIESIDNLNSFIDQGHQSLLQRNLFYFQSQVIGKEMIIANLIQSQSDPAMKEQLLRAKKALDRFAVTNYVLPYYHSPLNTGKNNTIVYSFTVPVKNNYEIVLKEEDWDNYYKPFSDKLTFALNGKIQTASATIKSGWIYFGTFALPAGRNEIELLLPDAKNLVVTSQNSQTLLAKSRMTKKSIPIIDFDPFSTYRLSLDYWITKGGPAKIGITTDVDSYNMGETIPGYTLALANNGYDNDWINTSTDFNPYPTASKASLTFMVSPYNDCLTKINPFDKPHCISDKKYHDQFNRLTVIQYKNLKLKRVFTNPLLLKYNNPSYKKGVAPIIHFKKINPSKYEVEVKNAKNPYYLVFSESFHPLWRITVNDTKSFNPQHILVNAYANAWYIDKKGDYTLTIKFTAEKVFTVGKFVTSVTILISFIILFFVIRKKGLKKLL